MSARGIDSARARGAYGCTMNVRLASVVEPAGAGDNREVACESNVVAVRRSESPQYTW
jgi:hypothetical protein